MSREQKMLAVVEAARTVLRERLGTDAAAWEVACARLDAALATLDAHTEAPQETVTLAAVKEAFEGAKAQNKTLRSVLSSQPPMMVTLAVWATSDGAVALVTPGTRCDHPDHPLDRRLGTFTLALDREGGR